MDRRRANGLKRTRLITVARRGPEQRRWRWTMWGDTVSRSIAPIRLRNYDHGVPNPRKLTYTVILEEDPPKYWHAYAPAVPGCFGGGRTRAEALRQYRAALRLHLDVLTARGGSLPIERRSPAVQVIVAA